MKNISGAEYSAQKYIELPVREPQELMDFLLKQMSGISRNRVKDLLSGHAVSVDRKLVTQYNYMLKVGEMVRVSRHKRSTELINKHIKIIYEDIAATIGAKADLTISRYARFSPAKELLADAYFTERIEALCDTFTAKFNRPERRFSPGYGDLPLTFQRVLFEVLDCPRSIGLTLGENLLMMPTKSVTAVIGRKEL